MRRNPATTATTLPVGIPVVLWIMLATATLAACSPDPKRSPSVAHTQSGQLRGQSTDGVLAFKGIPYAASTAGRNRFMPPRAPGAWQGIRDASAPGDRCPQLPVGATTAPLAGHHESEDCLVLNVFTPALRDGARRPVLFWIHGGGFSVGSGYEPATDGVHLARRGDVVVVSVNHRLNVFGYGYFAQLGGPAFAQSGNVGQLDLIAALRWVHDNIAEFGGDPGNVTIFGQSGGGAKIGNLLATPAAHGLFSKAILQSGPGLTSKTIEEEAQLARDFMQAMDLPPGDVAKLQQLSTQELLEGLRKLTQGDPTLGFAPMVDGTVLQRQPFTPDAPEISADIPILIGYTATETTVMFPTPDLFSLDWPGLRSRLAPKFPDRDVDAIIGRLREALPAATPSRLYFVATTEQSGDRSYVLATRKAAQHRAPVWVYRLEWETPVDGGRLMSPHGLDVPLVFDNVGTTSTTRGDAEADAHKVADVMSRAWISFARTGNPNGPDLPQWPPYDGRDKPTMLFDVHSSASNDPVGKLRAIILDQ